MMNSRFDVATGEIGRIARTYLRQRWLPLGNLGGMTRLRELFILIVMHRCGGPLFRLLIPYEHRLTRLYLRLRHRKK
ncbi:hypothetical protein [Desulfobulbus alkaliphilus]|uniref:hypothetical protein n=1 Tax=Desulfobulbus alkaliphilus TaxID=869814 RepID=UPI0019647388|nr:hypothetical protein [Desulfobulbus alkaliphilus]